MSQEGKIANPGTLQASGAMTGALAAFVLIGAATFAAALSHDAHRAWSSFVLNHFFFLCLGLGGMFFAAIQWLTGAMWSAPVRRLSEAFTSYLPIAVVTTAAIYFGIHHLYTWSHPAQVKGDLVLEYKSSYMQPLPFVLRTVAYVVVWVLFARTMVGNSLAQDQSGDYALTLKNRRISPIFLIVFGLTFTLTSFDLVMSLDSHWYSTMFGVYCFAGLFYANLASTCLLALWLRSKGKLDGILNENHLHDLGKFMFAFTIFYAYIGFSQFMLIWYANMPEETEYFLRRFAGGWEWVSIFLLVGKFMTPFFLLLPRDAKRNPRMLAFVAVFMLVAEWVDILWMVQPEYSAHGPVVGWVELGMFLGFLGLFGLAVTRFLSKHNIVAIGDPRLAEAVYHHHQ